MLDGSKIGREAVNDKKLLQENVIISINHLIKSVYSTITSITILSISS